MEIPSEHGKSPLPSDSGQSVERFVSCETSCRPASAITQRCGESKLPSEHLDSTLHQSDVNLDGALPSEKYFHTVRDDFHSTRESVQWQHIVGLARMTASKFGRPAVGQLEARQLLGIA